VTAKALTATLTGCREGIHVFSQPRALPAASREQVSAGTRVLDMDDPRAELAESQPASVAS